LIFITIALAQTFGTTLDEKTAQLRNDLAGAMAQSAAK
jgi:hypothetical protein